MKDIVNAIHPTRGEKYSPNLHRYARRHVQAHHRPLQAWRDQAGELYLGYMDPEVGPHSTYGFVGAKVMRILRDGLKTMVGWHNNIGPGNMTPGNDFWDDYIARGRCAVDTDHRQFFIGDQGRYSFSADGQYRTCNWCGANHKKHTEVKLIEQIIERFEPVSPKPTKE